jgi:hypothetical protein
MFNENFAQSEILHHSEVFIRRTQLCWKLSRWQDQLPPPLAIITSQEMAESQHTQGRPERFRIYLTLRCLHLKVLLHRRVLEVFMVHRQDRDIGTSEAGFMQEHGMAALKTCLNSCTEIIGIVAHVVSASAKGITLCNAWWLTAYYSI